MPKTLRKILHTMPEPALRETRTKETLMHWIRENTSLTPKDMGTWFYCETDGAFPALALRADFDAVEGKDGVCGHFCGHDGHAAILCGAAKRLSEMGTERRIVFVFQPAEETGEGAAIIAPHLKTLGVSEIYGLHNIPGKPKGAVLLRNGVFACASTGLEITVTGTPAHAAYPEAGKNPAPVIAELIRLSESLANEPHRGIVRSTVIGADIGGHAYGVSASKGTLRLTVRGEYADEFEQVLGSLRKTAEALCTEKGMSCEIREIERFPSTENTPACLEKVHAAAEALGLPTVTLTEPMRWSEDFGGYLRDTEGAFFGIGAGEDHPELHTEGYEFPDDILDTAVKMLTKIAENG